MISPVLEAVAVQTNLVARHSAPLAMAARDRGVSVIDISFDGDASLPTDLPDNVFVYGSVDFCKAWRMRAPSAIAWDEWLLSPPCWRQNVPQYLNKDGYECRFIDAPKGWHKRPIVNDKQFTGGIEVEGKPETAVWTSPPKQIDAEIRSWFVGGNLVASRVYKGSSDVPPLPSIWRPFANVVADWAISEEGIRLVEFNCINSSGWYGEGVPGVVLDALRGVL